MSFEMKKVKSIIFDLDGTLINSIPDVLLALNHTLITFGQRKIEDNEINNLIGNGAKHLLRSAFKKFDAQLVGSEMDLALECYLNYYSSNPIVETKLYPNVIDVLHQLKNEKVGLSICTNKPSVITRIVLEKLNLSPFFSTVICGDEVPHPKPHAQHLFEVLKSMNANPEQSVLVGDSEVDELAAQNANLAFIGVTYGYELKRLSSKTMINHFHELPEALRHITTQEKIT